MSERNELTRFPPGSFRELAFLAFPMIISSLSACLLTLCDRLFLAHVSTNSLNAVTAAINPVCLLQNVLMTVPLVSQGFIGHYSGANQDKKIGPFVWQMIYFSFLSMLITLPLSQLFDATFKGLAVEREAQIYLRYLAAVNFLYPLGASLAAFFLGRGKMSTIFYANLIIQGVNICLDYLLIFGVSRIIPPLGVKGAAIATMIAQSLYCLILFSLFLKKKHVEQYGIDQKAFNFSLLKEGLKTAIPRALGRCFILGTWTASATFVIKQGGDSHLVYSFGVTMLNVIFFIGEGMGQALVTIASYSLGSMRSALFFRKAIKSALKFVGFTSVIFAFPLFFMQDTIIGYIVKEPLSVQTHTILITTCFYLWIGTIGSGVMRIGIGLATAARDTLFYALSAGGLVFTIFVPLYIGIEYLHWPPTALFFIDATSSTLYGSFLIFRFIKSPYRHLKPKTTTMPPIDQAVNP